GYGSSGPYSNLPGQDLLAQSMSGYTWMVGPKGPPMTGGIYVVDMYSSMLMVSGVLAALVNKQNGGKAQKVEVNLLNSGIHLQSQEFGYFLNTGIQPERPGGHTGHPMQESPYGIYETKDGYMSLATNASDNIEWFAQALEIPELPQLMPDKETMRRDRDKIYPVISSAIAKRTTDEWIEMFRAQGIWCAKVNDYNDVVNDPQVIHNGIIQEIDHPKAGKVRVIGSPIEFSETPCKITRRPPLLGEHNDEILGELGYTPEQISELKEKGIF
ncbi:MAG: CoA transferase, partial [Oscillospiraceae bacterium]